MMTKVRRILAVVLIVCLVCMGSTVALASNLPIGEEYQYQLSDGTIVNYYLDEDLWAYQIIEGEKIYLLLPLEHLKVKDPTLLSQVQSQLPENPIEIFANNVTMPYAIPTDYYDLSGSTNSYRESLAFLGEELFYSPIFKYARTHNSLTFHTPSISPLLGKINLVYSAYDIYLDEWTTTMYTGENFQTSILKFNHFPKTMQYGQFTIAQYDDINSLTYTVKSALIV